MSSLQPHFGGDEFDELDYSVLDSFIDPLAVADDGHTYSFNSIDLPGGSSNHFKATSGTTGCTIDQPSDITPAESNAAPNIGSQEFTRSFMSHGQAHSRRETVTSRCFEVLT